MPLLKPSIYHSTWYASRIRSKVIMTKPATGIRSKSEGAVRELMCKNCKIPHDNSMSSGINLSYCAPVANSVAWPDPLSNWIILLPASANAQTPAQELNIANRQ
jgi:hypothetical protein